MGKKVIEISINANMARFISGNQPILNEVYEECKVRHPNAFYLMRSTKGRWDGFVKYINGNGQFKIGLLPFVVSRLEEKGCVVKIKDVRIKNEIKPIVPTVVGKFTLRDSQVEAVRRIINNKICGTSFRVGVLNNATNYGKTLVMMALHEAFGRKLKTLILLNNAKIFSQMKKGVKDYLPGENIKFIQGKDKTFGNFNVGMVQTISRNIKSLQKELSQIDILLVDECDGADNKTYITVITHCYNAIVRVGLSGSIYLSKLKKDIVKNMNLRSLFGDELMIVSKRELMDQGISAEVKAKICLGNNPNTPGDNSSHQDTLLPWLEFFKKYVIDNEEAHELSLQRTIKNIRLHKRFPALIVVRYISHCKNLYKYYKKFLANDYTISMMHHQTKNGEQILEDFANGKIDILIITLIVKRGLNLPKARYMQNASGINSDEGIIQLLGRMERKEKGSKKISYFDDMYYYGKYLLRHSNHRVNYLIKQKIKVRNLIPKNLTKHH